MDINNVVVIIGKEFTKEDVVDIIREEGYQHNFFFNDGYDWQTIVSGMKIADEVWCFGDVSMDKTYKYALEQDYDCWTMG